jgi:hypothetical protein
MVSTSVSLRRTFKLSRNVSFILIGIGIGFAMGATLTSLKTDAGEYFKQDWHQRHVCFEFSDSFGP